MSQLPTTRIFTSYLNTQIRYPIPTVEETNLLPSVTVSRQAGAGGNTIARLLADRLNQERSPGSPEWMLFNQNLMREVLETNGLPVDIEHHFPEARPAQLQCAVESLINHHPAPWTVFEHTCSTIRRLLSRGHCIIVGRAAHLVGANVIGALHVRLVGSIEKRLQHLLKLSPGSRRATLNWIEKTDRDRKAYARLYFNHDIDNPADYTLVCNTDTLPAETVAECIAKLVRKAPVKPSSAKTHSTFPRHSQPGRH